MNYCNIIKEELNKYSENEMIFASKLYKEKLYKKKVTETSFYKVLERMCLSNELSKLSKGVYYYPKKSKFGITPISDEEIISRYIEKNNGMIIGYHLFNKLNLTTQVSKKITLYSTNVESETKNIRNIEIKNISLKINDEYKKIIEMLEVLQSFNKIQDLNYNAFYEYARNFSKEYNEDILKKVLVEKKYKKSTISFLRNILNYFEIRNELDKYLSSLSKYNHIDMEEVYESSRK